MLGISLDDGGTVVPRPAWGSVGEGVDLGGHSDHIAIAVGGTAHVVKIHQRSLGAVAGDQQDALGAVAGDQQDAFGYSKGGPSPGNK